MTDYDPIDLTHDLDAAQLDALAGLLADEAVWDEPDPAVEDRVVAAIVAEAAAAGSTGPAGPGAPARAPRRRGRGRVDGKRSGRSGLVLLAGTAAAAALIAVVVGVAALRSPPGSGGQQLALRPPSSLPSPAEGDALLDERADGTRILLDVRHLAPAAPGTYYEAWLRKSPQVGVSAGTFHLRGGGTEQIELWAAVSPRDYPLFTVTLQQEGGGAESSGKVVLAGRLG